MQNGHPSIAARLFTRIADGTVERASTYWALCAALVALASIPLVLGVYPPFIDYPFHLARIAMLSDWNASAFVREHYEIPSLLLPNLSLELVMLPLSKLMPAEVAGVVFIALMFALILSGTAALHRALFGMRSLWPLIAAAWLYNWIVFYGFMNYVFGIGVLLWCLTAWLRMAERAWWVRLLAGVCLAVVLFFCHLVAFILYAFAIAGYELQGLIMTWRRERRLDLLRVVVGAAQFVPALILYIAVSPTKSTTTRAFIYDFTGKAASLLVSLTSGNAMVDLLTIALLVLAVAAAIRWATLEIAPRFMRRLHRPRDCFSFSTACGHASRPCLRRRAHSDCTAVHRHRGDTPQVQNATSRAHGGGHLQCISIDQDCSAKRGSHEPQTAGARAFGRVRPNGGKEHSVRRATAVG